MENFSTRKIDINVALVRHLVDTQFPKWADLTIKPVEFSGWDNRTFHLGESMSVRLPTAEGYIPQAAKEQYWLPILASHLPLPIPTLLAQGEPDNNFPWKWGVYRWIEGETANVKLIKNLDEFAKTLAYFLRILHHIDPTGGPVAGKHSFFRGAPLLIYDEETRNAIDALHNEVDTNIAKEIWEVALASTWQGSPVWFHGDIASDNLIVKEGRLSAVIDFGCCGVGDPSCDLTIAWTLLFGSSREIFRTELNIDNASWSRGCGWALWKALITLQEHINTDNKAKVNDTKNTINAVFNDYLQRT